MRSRVDRAGCGLRPLASRGEVLDQGRGLPELASHAIKAKGTLGLTIPQSLLVRADEIIP